ncbi:MAG: hypothetical protein AABN95_08270 [Acidobacteriota bacterium]
MNNGLDDSCENDGGTTWTYNQGVILGGLVELFRVANCSKKRESHLMTRYFPSTPDVL